MKSITIDISDKVYHTFRKLLKQLPKGSFKIHDEDPDVLTTEEEKTIYYIQKKVEQDDFSEFEDWDGVKDNF